jgi:2-polyprenyl-3-methyl-5-hydroxy-6-metoxy-1,4-benzoquinol methylase
MLFHGRLFDFGAWLGNFSLAAHYAGCKVTAGECWDRYAPALQTQRELLHATGIDTVNIAKFYSESWDAVLLMSVIEHIPHTPRHLLKQVFDTLRPGGYLILDTPNLAYIANRRRLKHGVSPYVPIEEQFFTEIPFEGHNREYTAAEVEWMLTTTGFRVLRTSFYNYSMYGVSFPHLMNARSLLPMMLDPTKRELIFIVARKPDASGLRTTL